MRSIARASDSIFVQSGDVVRFPGYRGPVEHYQSPNVYSDPHALGGELLKSKGWTEQYYPKYSTTHYIKVYGQGKTAVIMTGPLSGVNYHTNYDQPDDVVSRHGSILEAYRHHQQINKRFTPRR